MKIVIRTLALVAGIALLPMMGVQSADAGSKDRATHRDTSSRTHVRAPAIKTRSMSSRWHDMMKRTTTRKTHVRAPATKTRSMSSRWRDMMKRTTTRKTHVRAPATRTPARKTHTSSKKGR